MLIGAHAANRYRLEARLTVDGVLTVEDVIIHNLIDGRPRDLDDIAWIRATGIPFDVADVVAHATEWGVLDRWSALTGD